MNKKILVGSIGAVIIVVLAGFTSVVGVNSAMTYDEKISPLFNLRAEKALNDENKEAIKTDYIGGEKNTLLIPYINFYKKMSSNKLIKDLTPEKYETEGVTYCSPTCSGLPTCNFMCEIFAFIIFAIIYLIFTLIIPGCTTDEYCSEKNFQSSVLSQKMDENPYLKKLIKSNPELLPEIMALNS